MSFGNALRVQARWCGLSALLLAFSMTTRAGSGVDVESGGLQMRITAVTDDILRVRIAAAGQLPEDASWAVPAALRQRSVEVDTARKEDVTQFSTATLKVRIEVSPLRLIVTDLADRMISADAPDSAVTFAGAHFTLRKSLPAGEHYFGLGDKTGPLDRRGQSFTNWNTDAYGFQESTDPIYKSIPFFLATGGAGGSFGIFLDNTWRSWFDFGHENPAVLSFGSDGGPVDYYLIYGPTPQRVLEHYTQLTGRPPLPPAWAFGFQQSRYSYMSAVEVEAVASRLRSEHIPADVIWLDIDYQDRNRPFTHNRRTFPDLPGLTADLKTKGMRLVAITDLHIAAAPGEGYAPYDSGIAGDHFLKQADGSLYVGEVWPGPSVFPDFTRSATREWWGGLYRDFLKAGIAGFWNDMNEPVVFKTPSKTMPPGNLHRIDEPGFAARTATHAEIHNVYGMQNSRATFEGLVGLQPRERPFVLTRASYAGGQRYAATWTGDNSSTWNHLKLSIPMLLNLGLSGFAYSGADVGGFVGDPDADLLTRWIQIAAFTPLFRVHSMKDTQPREPWVHGRRHTDIRRHYIEQRYRLMPYISALADENARTGAPLMRPLFYEFAATLESSCDQPTTFLLGDQLLIAPSPTFESPAVYEACLPSAAKWYDYWSGRPVRSGTLRIAPRIDRLPVFVRAGAIIPTQPLVQSTAQTPRGPLVLDVYPGDDCHGSIYLDDGHSIDYREQQYLRQAMRCVSTAAGLDIEFDPREGQFRPWWKHVEIRVHDWHGGASARLNGTTLRRPVSSQHGLLSLAIDDPLRASHLVLTHSTARNEARDRR